MFEHFTFGIASNVAIQPPNELSPLESHASEAHSSQSQPCPQHDELYSTHLIMSTPVPTSPDDFYDELESLMSNSTHKDSDEELEEAERARRTCRRQLRQHNTQLLCGGYHSGIEILIDGMVARGEQCVLSTLRSRTTGTRRTDSASISSSIGKHYQELCVANEECYSSPRATISLRQAGERSGIRGCRSDREPRQGADPSVHEGKKALQRRLGQRVVQRATAR